MKSLGKAPVFTGKMFEKYASLMHNENIQRVLSQIHEQYLYWDKVKYKNLENLSSEELWQLVKIRRLGNGSSLHFGNYRFIWNINNRLQSYLHFLDMNIGGTLESPS